MKRQLNLIPLVALLLASCATILPGHDAVVVNAERTTALAADTFDTFLKVEYQNQAVIAEAAPEVHAYANTIRRNGQLWLMSARAVTKAYKSNRTPENKASLLTAVAVLQAAMAEAQKYTAKAATVGAH